MNEKVLSTLEFNKIREKLANYCFSDVTKTRARRLSPKADLDKINELQKETEDAVNRALKKPVPGFPNPKDAREFAKRLEIGSTLNTTELLGIADLLLNVRRIKEFGEPSRDNTIADSLTPDFESLDPLNLVSREIERCIISEDEIADDASPGLSNIRRQIRISGDRIHEKMQSMLNSLRDYLQEPVITQRQGRYCLPVSANHKAKVPGMVHDQSGSGQTLFIEPMAVVELNNKLKELQLQEIEEIDIILANLSNLVYENIDTIVSDYLTVIRLDFIFARARLALEMNGLRPIISNNGIVNLKSARHPLLDPKTCVPIDIRMGEEFNSLIITGPNTGGKTVSIKTLGLLSIMAQSGLHIPAKDGSTLPLFYYIGADIGDEQSIEQSLSTFSSHMTNIKRILADIESDKRPSDHCLVLFDELCAGTDPQEGAALAISILDYLRKKGVKLMATTHYSELKVYALTTPGVENASMEFNVESLSPTYHLIIGAPGKSNAFAISKKLGIPDSIIDNAKKRLNESDISVEELLSGLEERRVEIERAKSEILRDKEEIAALRESIKNKEERLEKQKNDILEKANQKASNILKDAKDTADAAIRNINKYGSVSGDVTKLEKDRANLGKKLKTTQGKAAVRKPTETKKSNFDSKRARIGDSVHIISMNLDGTLQSLPGDKDECFVQIGIMRSRIKTNDLILIDEQKAPKEGKRRITGTSGSINKAMNISAEIKLLGMTSDEALTVLDKYLDDAYISRLSSVRIVHGKGTGVLRQAVADYLRRHPLVKSYKLAEYGEGDSGVTIAEFK